MAYGRGEKNYARETLKKLRDCFDCWILPTLGSTDISSVTRAQISALRVAMRDRGVGVNRQYSVFTTLKAFFKFCQTVLKLNCLDPREIELPKRKPPFVQYLTNAEVQRLRAAVPLHTFTGLRLRTLVEVLLNTGLRISEALALNRKPFDLGEREVEIVGKGGKRRIVFFNDDCVCWINRYLKRRADFEAPLFVTTGFPRRVDRADTSKMFVRLRRDAQIDKNVTPHMLRHTYCTNLLANGADITFIKELAGHQDIQTTARYYLGVDRGMLRQVVGKCLDYGAPTPQLDGLRGYDNVKIVPNSQRNNSFFKPSEGTP